MSDEDRLSAADYGHYGIKAVAGIELIVILTEAAFDLIVMARSIRAYKIVADTRGSSG